jgi:hypothetical protein
MCPAEKLLKKMCASRGLSLLLARERSPSGAANTAKEPDMTTTKRAPRRRIIATTWMAAAAVAGAGALTTAAPAASHTNRDTAIAVRSARVATAARDAT